jgi:hypothetical protein
LRVFEKRVLRRIFSPKWKKVTWWWRKLHNEQLHNIHSSPDIMRMINSGIVQIVSEGFWRWCIAHGISGFLDFIHRPVFQGTHDVSETGSVSMLRWKKGGRHLLSWAP